MLDIYGIKNCNTVKKALNWLDENKKPYTFHDFKKEPATNEKLEEWISKSSWESLVNKKGMTWRKLTDERKNNVIDKNSAIEVLLKNNSMIKRPIVEVDGKILLGFNESEYGNNI